MVTTMSPTSVAPLAATSTPPGPTRTRTPVPATATATSAIAGVARDGSVSVDISVTGVPAASKGIGDYDFRLSFDKTVVTATVLGGGEAPFNAAPISNRVADANVSGALHLK